MEIKIICNEKGMGKTTYVKKKYFPYQYFDKSTIENFCWEDSLQHLYCIIDSVDSIPQPIFNISMNKILLLKWKAIILIFDINKTELMNCPNFNMIWECGIIPRNYEYVNFTAKKEVFYNYFQAYYPELNKSSYDNIIEITEYNFKKVDRLMLLNHLHTAKIDEIDIKALTKYIDEAIQIKYKDIPDADILLKKASIIGEQFACDALESSNGFGYESASAYLRQMNEMHGFIRTCIDINTQYEFISHDVYKGIFEGITNENKLSWLKILIHYYKFQYEHCTNISKQLSILNKLNDLYKLLPLFVNERKSICFLLLYKYRLNQKIYNALEIAEEIIKELSDVISSVERAFVHNYQIQTFMKLGEYKQAKSILENIQTIEKYPGSRMLIKYYYAYCLFQTGDVDLSYTTVLEIVDYLKMTSGTNKHSQELFCMTYSLMATLQNHLNLEDNGMRYFHLALNNAYSKLENKIYYYDILKKCDMFYDFDQTKESLQKCLEFYEQQVNQDCAGEVCINLATEMMFQDGVDSPEIKIYFDKALSYFSEYNNEKLAYAKNNYGIYCIMLENNIEKGLKYFKEALLVGLTDFSYMTIYLNICMCYILLGNTENDEFLDAYIHFNFAKKKLERRQHKSKYENIYEMILRIILDEHQGKNVISLCQNTISLFRSEDFFVTLLNDIIKRNRQMNDSFYKNNSFYYTRMNQLRCFFAEFRFWE